MMNRQPDNFFREKLENYQKPAPEGAWGRIELNLKKNKNKFGWWKIAASLLLLATLAYLLLPNVENSTPPIAQKATDTQSSPPETKNSKTQHVQRVPNQDAKKSDSLPSSNKATLPKKITAKNDKVQKVYITPEPAKKNNAPK